MMAKKLSDKLIEQWHPSKNGNLLPFQVAAGSKSKRWWLGECGHEWESAPKTRGKGTNCPFCAGRLALPGFNDLASRYPDLALEWHTTENGELTPDRLIASSRKKVWWLGECGHEWEATASARVAGSDCPICAATVVRSGFNDLASRHPDFTAQWHPVKNEGLSPDKIAAGSKKLLWWLGECGHEWRDSPSERKRNRGCPTCSGRIILERGSSVSSRCPDLVAQWHPTRNGALTPDQIAAGSGRKVWWLCAMRHEWQACPLDRWKKGSNCIICAGKVVLPGFNDLASKHPDLAAQWHPTKNNDLKPTQVTPGTRKKAWWLGECGHEWEALVADRASNGSGCHYCSNQRALKGFNDLESLYPEVAVEWHPTLNGSLTPASVTKSSGKKAWWTCPEGHEPYYSAISHRTRIGKYTGCPKCGEAKVGRLNGLPKAGQNFAKLYPHLLREWHPTRNILKPEELKPGADVRAWWICENRHEWDTLLYQRTGGAKSGCPDCWASRYSSQPETELQDFLTSLGVSFLSNDKKFLQGKELDIYIPANKLAIEFNGLYWHTEEMGKHPSYHYDKWLACREKGVQLIQIWEDEWNFNPEQIKHMISHKLGLSTQRRVFARKTQVIQLDRTAAKSFLAMNHVQGFAKGSHYLGLTEIDNSQSEILAVLVLEDEPSISGKLMNIIRYATSVTLVGGFTKLLSHVTKEYGPDSYQALADHSVSTGNLFASNGFVAEKVTSPDYMYFTGKKREPKENLDEQRLAKLTDSKRIWDAGKTLYVLDMKSKMK